VRNRRRHVDFLYIRQGSGLSPGSELSIAVQAQTPADDHASFGLVVVRESR